MYLERLKLQKIACFEDLTLDFTRDGQLCPWVVLLGENGSGKSTLLQVIALSLLGGEMIHEIAGGVDWGRLARRAEVPGRIELSIVPQRVDALSSPRPIFLSYASRRPLVRDLYNRLVEADLHPWMDVEDILPGERWATRLQHAFEESALILLLLTEASDSSSSQQAEIRQALDLQRSRPGQGIFVIPVRLEPCPVPALLRDLQWVDLFEDGGFERMLRAIRQVLARPVERQQPRGAPGRQLQRFRAAFEVSPQFRTGLRIAEDTIQDLSILDSTLHSPSLKGGWFACAYGPWRRLSRADASRSRDALAISGRKSHRFATMFDAESALTRVHDWLIDLDYRRLKDRDDPSAERAFRLAVESLEHMLPGVRFASITSGGEVLFEEAGVQIPIHRLSDGYRSTLAWVGDLVRRLVEAFPDEKKPLAMPGVVLLDELDLHLHPKWQRSIVEEVRELFPNLQFIVSSHSPFVAQDARATDKIVVLRKHDGKVEAEEELATVTGWRVDQILTSNLFGLESTRGREIAEPEKELRGLLDQQVQAKLDPAGEARLAELKGWLDRHKSAPGETIQENEIFDAARSLISLVDQQLIRRPP